MKNCYFVWSTVMLLFLFATNLQAEKFIVNSQQEFNDAQDDASLNDSIIWEVGTYSDIYLNITKSNLFIGAAEFGGTIFTGASRVKVTGDYITLAGFQFIGGNIGTDDIINSYGSYNHFNQLNLKDYTCYKYLRIREECQYNKVSYCNFENRLNLDDQNILSILVDESEPGYHKIQYCSFKNFDGSGNDLGIEPIRIGLSTQADHISRSLVEYCYFTQCNGDGELISSKASQNVYRFNTFENNPKAELVLRHGSEAIVYGNFFIKGKGGVRVREGQDHYLYNNYFYELDDRAIFLQNESSDPLDNINIAFNTIVSCSEVILGSDGNNNPTNVTFANNIFADPDDKLFEEATGAETWISNLANGDLGITLPASGMTIQDPLLTANGEGFFGLSASSPAINSAMSGYALLPQFEGMELIDSDILFDLMEQGRPATVEDKDLGCSEFPHDVLIQPIATEANTGPSYSTDIINSINEHKPFLKNLIKLSPNPATDIVELTILLEAAAYIKIDILDLSGKTITNIFNGRMPAGKKYISQALDTLPSGVYTVIARRKDIQNGIENIQTIKLVKQD
ncbi:MAG: chondroitinase-B domain-containing protein [Saprospiraceae bacterium]